MGTYKYDYKWDFFQSNSEELYYFLGFVVADGYISDDEIEIGVNEKDIDILRKFRDLIVPDKPINRKKRTNSYTLKISCRSKTNEFKKFFGMVTNKKGEELVFPSIPDEYIKDFIRGYIDGDGTMDLTKGYKNTREGRKVYLGLRLRVLGNPNFLYGLNEGTKKLYNHNTNSINKKGNENVHVVTYNFSTAKAILDDIYIGSNIHLDRKYKIYMDLKQELHLS